MLQKMLYELSSELDKSGNKFECPKCGKKTLVKFVYNCSNEYVGDEYGNCARRAYCGYSSIPSYNFIDEDPDVLQKEQYGVDGDGLYEDAYTHLNSLPERFTHTIPEKYLYKSMDDYQNSIFAKILFSYIKDDAEELLKKYYVGRSDIEDVTGNIFWKIDNNFVIRYGIITLYDDDSDCGCIKKLPIESFYNPTLRRYTFFNCFFGAHLINVNPEKDIAIVERESVAIVCSYFWPEYNWLATGDIDEIEWMEYEVLNVLTNKKVILFSDYEFPVLHSKVSLSKWKEMAEYIGNEIPCSISVELLIKDKFNKLDEKAQELAYSLLKKLF